MWLDGQYMGPVLMAQLINYGRNVTGSAESDWDFITNQFNITWNHLWDKDKHLLYHAFSATPTDSLSSCWADPVTGRSQEFWARAEGWYFLALVDILEEMQKAKVTESGNYTILRQHLNELAKGIAQYQEQRTGCWYQLIDKGAGYNASSYKGVDMATKHNYLESSASALFIAAYYKGMRLALLDDDYSAMCEKAYRGFIETFVVDDHSPFGGIDIIGSCRSAGLGGKAKRDGSAPYYLLGPDVSVVKERDMQTEGKALGAFILAAIEYERAHPQE
jgi:unsaturated rhamnogalacturonyl hydrolase